MLEKEDEFETNRKDVEIPELSSIKVKLNVLPKKNG